MLNTKNAENKKEVDRGTLTLNWLRKFPAATVLRFTGGESFGGEQRRGSSRSSARQREERVAKARNSESLRWEVQSPHNFAGENGFGNERWRRSSGGREI
jgi:hypothetical protein